MANRVLLDYGQLGEKLGARIEYEWKRYDLCWFFRDEQEPWLHVEHKNAGSWNKLNDTLRKINESESDSIIAIVYPKSRVLWKKFLTEVDKSRKSWGKDSEVLVILDASYFEKNLVTIEGHIFFKKEGTEVHKVIKKTNEIGYYYAILK